MVLRIGQVHHRSGGRAQTDDALANPEPGLANRLGIQPLRGGQFENIARALNVNRADLTDQLGGDKLNERGQRRGPVGAQIPQPRQ